MAATKPIPVRLSGEITKRLDDAAVKIGNNRAGLIRLLIDSWLADYEKHGETILPPKWKEIMEASDHRTIASKVNSSVDQQLSKGTKFLANKVSKSGHKAKP